MGVVAGARSASALGAEPGSPHGRFVGVGDDQRAATGTTFSSHFVLAGPGDATGGSVTCPDGTRALIAGAVMKMFNAGGSGTLTGMGISRRDRVLGFVGGTTFTGAGDAFSVLARCVGTTRLKGATQVTKSIQNHTKPTYVTRLVCPRRTVPFGGGAWTRAIATGIPDPAGLEIYGSFPQGRAWIVAAFGTLGANRELLASTWCLPRRHLGDLVTRTRTEDFSRAGLTHFFGRACPDQHQTVAGGVWLHKRGSTTPKHYGYLSKSRPSSDQHAWRAKASTLRAHSGAVMSVRVRCTTRLS